MTRPSFLSHCECPLLADSSRSRLAAVDLFLSLESVRTRHYVFATLDHYRSKPRMLCCMEDLKAASLASSRYSSRS